MAIEIVSLPIKHGGSFHSYVNVYQRVQSQSQFVVLGQIEHSMTFPWILLRQQAVSVALDMSHFDPF